MQRTSFFLMAPAVLLTAASLASAVTIQVQSDILDHEAHKTVSSGVLAVSNGTGGDNRIGSRTTATLSSSILPFTLPAVGSASAILSATLNVTFEGESASLRIEAGDGNVDLYGLPYQAAPFVQDANRYFSGANDATAGVTKLQDDFFTVAEYPAESTTVAKVSVDVGDYLRSLYTSGATAGDIAVLRLSYDIDALSGNNRYRVVTSGGDGNTVDSAPHTIADGAPFLSVEIVPEPTSLGLLGFASAGLAFLQRLFAAPQSVETQRKFGLPAHAGSRRRV